MNTTAANTSAVQQCRTARHRGAVVRKRRDDLLLLGEILAAR